ncbi:(2Fe-2S) ferredoxin domain-containing protein [Arhodomonas sp. AD133]|uniref:(2Fe-2S) ferredoxin domain-containing protein n=1 Tax=Arhodomonas sp. AD133 TaxID=3415009 RepID=UPI003EBDE49E
MTADAIVYVIAPAYLGARRARRLADGLCADMPVPTRVVRLTGRGGNLPAALDAMTSAGARHLHVQPVGLPFSDSVAAWLPGALAHWLQTRAPANVTATLGEDQCTNAATLATVRRQAIDPAHPTEPTTAVPPSLGKPGWDHMPVFEHHLLVCTGPRCHFRDAPSLRAELIDALRTAGLWQRCLVSETSCLIPCNRGPIVAHYPRGRWFRLPDRTAVQRFVDAVLLQGGDAPELVIHDTATSTGDGRAGSGGCRR